MTALSRRLIAITSAGLATRCSPRTTDLPRLLAAIITAAAIVLLSSCAADPRQGYAMVSPYDSSKATIAVPMFDNFTYTPDLEAYLTEAIIKEIHRATPWRVVNEAAADTILTGAITGADLQKLGTDDQSGLVEELAATLTVFFEWRDASTGEVLVARRRFTAAEAFVPALGAGEQVELGRRSAIDELAAEIVDELRSAW